MVERAVEAGVHLRWQTHVQLQPDGSVTLSGQQFRYGCLIGADGQSSRVRRWAGLDRGRLMSRRFGFRQHFAVAPWSPYVEVYWGRNGQAYVAPVGNDQVCVVGMARDPQMRLADLLPELPLLAAKLHGAKVQSDPLDAERGGLMTTRRLRHVARGRVALISDASGSVDAITGEGLALGFRQALLLADCLAVRDVESGLKRYDKLHGRILNVPQTMSMALLLMDRYASLRTRAMRMLASDQGLFARMLGVHVGAESLTSLLLSKGPEIAWKMIMPVRSNGENTAPPFPAGLS